MPIDPLFKYMLLVGVDDARDSQPTCTAGHALLPPPFSLRAWRPLYPDQATQRSMQMARSNRYT